MVVSSEFITVASIRPTVMGIRLAKSLGVGIALALGLGAVALLAP
jgi:hypothetical protein